MKTKQKPRNQIKKSNWGKIVHESMGCFLEPPRHPAYSYSVSSVYGNTFSMSLESAASCDWLDIETGRRARTILKKWTPLPINDAQVVKWIHQVLGYFKNCYSPNGKNRNVSDCKIIEGDPFQIGIDNHLGVLHIRETYPKYIPNKQDFDNAGWGKNKA